MPPVDENGNPLPSEQGDITNESVEQTQPTDNQPLQEIKTDGVAETPTGKDETPPPVELTWGSDFYLGKETVDPKNPLIKRMDPKEFDANRNKENR